jgi:DNA end-binding protein Ku
MAATVWKGYIAFGLVSIPVRLARAARAERVPLRQLYRVPKQMKAEESEPEERAQHPEPDAEPEEIAPVRRTYESAVGTEKAEPAGPIVPSALVKGYEYEKGQYVVVDEQDLRSLAPKTTTEMQIVEFVRLQEVDPVYLETSYYITPEESGEKAYALLFDAMRQTGYAAIGEFAMHRRDHVVILRAGQSGLLAHTMFYPDEVRSIQEFRTDTSSVTAKELELAKSLIQALATPFEPEKFKNSFRERLKELIESRAGERQAASTDGPKPAKVVDIMDALRRSLAQVAPAAEPPAPARKPARTERGPRTQPRVNAGRAK